MSLMALETLFRLCREKATGHFKLGQEPGRTIYLDMGDIVFAQSNFPQDRLTQLLVERGKITQAQLDYALANLKPGISIGKNLIEMGFITQRDLLEVARLQVERVVSGALGVVGVEPHFDSREDLETTIVRLPMDTAQLLLNGVLGLQDRERMLELLGPLNQVVVLQGRRLQEMTLPADLAKLPALLDGTHTLLELSREAGVEPLRLGAFALFLRELGWARLHELPPVDRGALDLALGPVSEPQLPALGLPEAAPEEAAPSLFATIQDASRPTTNLEHLSLALDSLDDPAPDEPLPSPYDTASGLDVVPPAEVDAFGFRVETGQAILATPAFPLPETPEAEEDQDFPPVTLGAVSFPDELAPEAPPPPPELPKAERKLMPWVLVGLALLALGGGAWWLRHRRKAPRTAPVAAPVAKPPVAVAPKPEPTKLESPKAEPAPEKPETPPKVEPVKPEVPKVVAPKLEPKVDAKVDSSLGARLEALKRGDLERAVKQGEAHRRGLGANQWTLRLEIACQGETLRRAVEFFQPNQPDLFILPLTLRDGRTCYQVYWGRFGSKAEAEAQVGKLPAAFREGGNRPKAFQVAELPEHQ